MRNFIRNIYNSIPNGSIIMAHHVCDDNPTVPSCKISSKAYHAYLVGKNIVSLNSMLKQLQPNSYAITFDDGLEDLYTEVYPYMVKNKLPFTAFVSTSLIDKPGYITSDQLKEMAKDPLVTIGSHCCTHRHLSALDDAESHDEIYRSKAILEAIISKEVKLIAYPYGDAGKREYRFAHKAGYTYGFDVIPRKYNLLSKLFMRMKLPRYNLTNECPNPV